MFTVRHIEENGYEGIVQAKVVNFFPHGEGNVGDKTKDTEPPMVVGYECIALTGMDTTNRWSTGEVFVMNEQGKTVARYRLKFNG